jgi:hypothetical protein
LVFVGLRRRTSLVFVDEEVTGFERHQDTLCPLHAHETQGASIP